MMHKSVTLVIVIIFLLIAGIISAFVAVILSTEFQFGLRSHRSEMTFYAADSGMARAKQLVKDHGGCSGWASGPPLTESYTVGPNNQQFSYTINCDDTSGITITVESSAL